MVAAVHDWSGFSDDTRASGEVVAVGTSRLDGCALEGVATASELEHVWGRTTAQGLGALVVGGMDPPLGLATRCLPEGKQVASVPLTLGEGPIHVHDAQPPSPSMPTT